MQKTLTVTLVNIETGETFERQFNLDDPNLSWQVTVTGDEDDISLADWAMEPEASVMFRESRAIPAYALFSGPLEMLAEIGAEGTVIVRDRQES